MPRLIAILLIAASLVLCGADEGLNPQDLLKPLCRDWPTFNGDYSGRRYSALAQINQSNVRRLSLAWVLQAQSAAIKSMPLEVNGISTSQRRIMCGRRTRGVARLSGTSTGLRRGITSAIAGWGSTKTRSSLKHRIAT